MQAETYHQVRDKVKFKLQELGIDMKDVETIEKGIYNWSIDFAETHKLVKNWRNSKFMNVYNNKAISMYANLCPDSYIQNQRLLIRLQEKEFMPQDVPYTSRDTLFPERWKDAIDKKMKKDEFVYEERPAAMTNQFKCSKCKKRECSFQELQLRSCDEPMTLFITCLNCGNRWRIG
jgi:DNA-directed RNA polymerase subunit M/transcription elongation factor TFIIS